MKYAPIAIPTLCRYQHFSRLIESLKRNPWAQFTDVFIGLDYPLSEKYRDGWKEISHYLEEGDFSVFASFRVFKRECNYGFEKNSAALKTEVFKLHDRIIELTDDLEVAPCFIEYMDKSLDWFENDENVVCVTGYSYPVNWVVSQGATCMKQDFNASEWGRGLWKEKYEACAQYLNSGQMLDALPKVIKTGTYRKMIDPCKKEYIIAATNPCFYQSRFLKTTCDIGMRAYLAVASKYCISPIVSKVRNHGFDGTGLYCEAIPELDNNHALSYDYEHQPIDKSISFELLLNDEPLLEENRKRLNKFDSRSNSEMKKTEFLIWLMNQVGIQVGKLYSFVTLPYDFSKRAFSKIKRIING